MLTINLIGFNFSTMPVNAGCQRSKGLARISNKVTGQTLALIHKVEVYKCANSWGSNGGYEFKGELVQWMKCIENCTNPSAKGKNILFFQHKEQGIGIVKEFAGATCIWQSQKIKKFCWYPVKSFKQ